MELVLASISNNEGSGPTGDSMIGLCGWDGGIYLETRISSRLDKPKITKIDLLVEPGDLHSIGRLMTSGPVWSCFYPTSCWFHSLASKNDIIFGYCRGAWEESPTPLSHGPLPGDNPPKKTSPAFAGAALKAAVLGGAAFWMDPEEPCFRMGLQEMECYYDTILME
jgi:hypothetical protein